MLQNMPIKTDESEVTKSDLLQVYFKRTLGRFLIEIFMPLEDSN